MSGRTTVTVLLTVLVVIAGCSAVGGGSTDDEGVPTTASAGSDGETAGSADGATLVENRTAALVAAGSYTSTWRMASSEDGHVVGSTTYTHAVDYGNERSSFGMRMTDGDEVSSDYETFHADGVSYTRYGVGEDSTYGASEAAFAPGNTLFPVRSYVADADDLSAFTAVGAETYDGVTVTRYERTDRPAWIGTQGAETEFTWTEFTYTVLIDRNGLVRSEGWRGAGVADDGVTGTVEFSYSLTAVGSTVIEEPEWIGAARDPAGR